MVAAMSKEIVMRHPGKRTSGVSQQEGFQCMEALPLAVPPGFCSAFQRADEDIGKV